jgi:hypothetical protein
MVAGRSRFRWWAAGMVSLAAFVLASWVSGALILARLLPSGNSRWSAALGVGAAEAAFGGWVASGLGWGVPG